MLGFCELCETDETGVMFVNGVVQCYECAVLTDDVADEEIEEVL
jgi:hypothetical protein